MKVYVCYSQEDISFARGIYALLTDLGARVFFDKESITPGIEWEKLLDREIVSSDVVVLLWSVHAEKSPWVMQEVSKALIHNKRIIPCVIDNTRLAVLIENLQSMSWTGSDSDLAKLCTAIGIDRDAQERQKGPRTLADSLVVYHKAMRTQYGTLRPLGRGADATIESLYMPLFIRLAQQSTPSEPQSADRLISPPTCNAVILGHPGTGKSTLMKYLAFLIAGSEESFPVFLRISDLMSTNDPLHSYINLRITGIIGKAATDLIVASEGFLGEKTILLLDGLDEIGVADRSEFEKRLRSFRTAYPRCNVFITSRYAGFQLDSYCDFKKYELLELSRQNVKDYIFKVCPEELRDQAWHNIDSDSRLSTLARTPFLLAMMCATPTVLGKGAAQRATLFEKCTKYLLRHEDWQDVERQRLTPELSYLLEEALKVIAVRFFKLDVHGEFDEEEVIFVIRSTSKPQEALEPREILDKIISVSGLLQKVGASIGFVHRSIWEYFVAQGMRGEPIVNLLERATIPSWEEPIRLYVGLLPEESLLDVLRGLWERNKNLALRAMTELPTFPRDILTQLISSLDREERVRLVFQLEENLRSMPDRLERIRSLLDTVTALFNVERDCEVLYRCIRLLEEHAERYDSLDCASAVDGLLDLSAAEQRRRRFMAEPKNRLDFIMVHGGAFRMGTDEPGRTPDERPAHDVVLDTFYVSKCQVTNHLYYSEFPFCENRRDARSSADTQPVIFITWYEAYVFARWIGCHLPTEAEWEYACRAGGNDDGVLFDFQRIREFAWYVENSDNATHDVASLSPNSLGIHDMLGNVREWCSDWFDPSYYSECMSQGLVKNPQGPSSGSRKALRGGCFDWNVANLVPTYRNYNPPDNVYYANGFRLVIREKSPETTVST